MRAYTRPLPADTVNSRTPGFQTWLYAGTADPLQRFMAGDPWVGTCFFRTDAPGEVIAEQLHIDGDRIDAQAFADIGRVMRSCGITHYWRMRAGRGWRRRPFPALREAG